MTRENKLALVVGFALILLVGILISDHFSTASNQASAELTQITDPLDDGRWENPDLIALDPGRAVETSAAGPPRSRPEPGSPSGVRAIDPVSGAPRPSGSAPAVLAGEALEMGRPARTPIGLSESEAEALPYRFHDVREGESLTSICRDSYGDATLIHELARYNDMRNADRLTIGRRIRIPDASDLVRNRRPQAPRREPDAVTEAAPATEAARRYTVKKGDSLSEIAQELLGSGRKYLVIYRHNRDVLKSPDDLRPGMVLKIPPRTG